IHVKPQIVVTAYIRDCNKIIDDPGVGCSCGGYCTEWLPPGSSVLLDILVQLLWIELELGVYRDAPQCLPANAEQTSGFVQRVMCFGRRIQDRLSSDRSHTVFDCGREFGCQGKRQSTEIRLVPTAGKRSVERA